MKPYQTYTINIRYAVFTDLVSMIFKSIVKHTTDKSNGLRLIFSVLIIVFTMSLTGCKIEYDVEKPLPAKVTPSPEKQTLQNSPDNEKEEILVRAPHTPCLESHCTLKKEEATVNHVVDPEIIIGYSVDDLEYQRVRTDYFKDNISYSRFFHEVMSKESIVNQLELTDHIYQQYTPYLEFYAGNQYELIYMLVSLVNSFPETIQTGAPKNSYLYPADSFIYGVKTSFQRYLLLMDMLSYYGIWHSLGEEGGVYTLGIPLNKTELEPHLLFINDLGLVENSMRSYIYPHKNKYDILSNMNIPVNTATLQPQQNIYLDVTSDFSHDGKQILNTTATDNKKIEELYKSNIAIIRIKDNQLYIDPIFHTPSMVVISGPGQTPRRTQ